MIVDEIIYKILRIIRLNYILKILNHFKGDILDIGCTDNYLKNKLNNYTGIDIEPKSDDIIKMSVEKLNISKRYDIVLCLETLEHLDDPAFALNKIKKIAKKYIIISVPNEPFFTIFRFLIQDKAHKFIITRQGLIENLGKPVKEKFLHMRRIYLGIWEISK